MKTILAFRIASMASGTGTLSALVSVAVAIVRSRSKLAELKIPRARVVPVGLRPAREAVDPVVFHDLAPRVEVRGGLRVQGPRPRCELFNLAGEPNRRGP